MVNKTFLKVRDRAGNLGKLYTIGTPFDYFTGDITVKGAEHILELKLKMCNIEKVEPIPKKEA